MMSRLLLLPAMFVMVLSVSAYGARYDRHRLVQVDLRTQEQLDAMLAISNDCWCENVGVGTLDFRVPPERMEALDQSGIRYRVLIDDLQDVVDAERARLAAANAADGPVDWYADFKDLAAIETRINDIAATYPGIVQVLDIGDSIEGRDIWAVRITGPGTNKPAVLYNACQHAREWISPMTAMFILEELATKYGDDPHITSLVDAIEFFVIPVVNPDGYEFTWVDDRFWRKNRRDNGDGTMGVDPNRNWDFQWGGPGASSSTGDPTYRGPAPFSEPETQAMRDFYIAHPNLVASIDFHAYSQLVLYPWAYQSGGPNDNGMHATIGAEMAQAILDESGLTYVEGPVQDTLYVASGASVDWTWGDQGVLSFTVELRPETSTPGFAPPPEAIRPTAEENILGALVMAEAASTGLSFRVPGGVPETIPADLPYTLAVEITPVASGPLNTASATLFWRVGASGAFTPITMTHLGDASFEVTLPGMACNQSIEFYFQIGTALGTTYVNPMSAPIEVFSTETVGILTTFADDFEVDQGWSVENIDLADGGWERGVPAGAGDRGDPLNDSDGSGQCWLTDNVAGNSDVDGGPTRLTSPTLDLSAMIDPMLTYARWFSNDAAGSDPDRLDVELSDDDGGSWTLVESVDGAGGWSTITVRVADYVLPSSTNRVRFSVTDNPNNSVTEGAIDAVAVFDLDCPAGPTGDLNDDGLVNFADILVVIGAWGPCAGCPEDLSGDGTVGFDDILIVIANWS